MAGLLKNIFGGSKTLGETIGKDKTSLKYLMEKLANEAKTKEDKKSDNSNRIDQMPKGSNKGGTIKNGGTGVIRGDAGTVCGYDPGKGQTSYDLCLPESGGRPEKHCSAEGLRPGGAALR